MIEMSLAFLDLKGVSILKDPKLFEKDTDVSWETEVTNRGFP